MQSSHNIYCFYFSYNYSFTDRTNTMLSRLYDCRFVCLRFKMKPTDENSLSMHPVVTGIDKIDRAYFDRNENRSVWLDDGCGYGWMRVLMVTDVEWKDMNVSMSIGEVNM